MDSNKLVALYCRTARKNKDVPDIQKEQLLGYVKEHGITNYVLYRDDGFSGLNFNRPSFLKMKSDIIAGKIEKVVIRDMGRIARDIRLFLSFEKLVKEHDVIIVTLDGDYENLRESLNVFSEQFKED